MDAEPVRYVANESAVVSAEDFEAGERRRRGTFGVSPLTATAVLANHGFVDQQEARFREM